MSELLTDKKNQMPMGGHNGLLIDNVSVFSLQPDYVDKSTKENDGRVYLTGIFSKADVPNQNSRIYPRSILEREVNKLMPLIKDNQIYGQLDHPSSSIIEFSTASHLIKDLWWGEDGTLYGKIQVLREHESGKKILAALKEEGKIGISSRAVGGTEAASMHAEYAQYPDTEIVTEDLNLLTWDVVINPSVYGAFLSPITENLMVEWNNKRINSLPQHTYTDYDKELIGFIQKYKR